MYEHVNCWLYGCIMSYPSEVCKRVNCEWTMAEVIRKKQTIGLSRKTGCTALKKLSLKHACPKKKSCTRTLLKRKFTYIQWVNKKIKRNVTGRKNIMQCTLPEKRNSVFMKVKGFVPIPNHPPPSQKARGQPLIASVLLYCALWLVKKMLSSDSANQNDAKLKLTGNARFPRLTPITGICFVFSLVRCVIYASYVYLLRVLTLN